jgi:hypothetical protein
MVLLLVLSQNSKRRIGMKNMKFNILISAFLVLAFATSCKNSSAESKDDPAILQYAATAIANSQSVTFTPQETHCLANVAAMNTCIGGAGQGEGFNGSLCKTASTLALLGSKNAMNCISTEITRTSCNLTPNKYIDKAAATTGGFKVEDKASTFGGCLNACTGATSVFASGTCTTP